MEKLLTSLQNQPTAWDLIDLILVLIIGALLIALAVYCAVKLLFWVASNVWSHFQHRAHHPYHSSFKDRPNAGIKY